MPDDTPPTAFASWDSDAGLWWPVDPLSDGLFAPLEPFSGSWPTSGMTLRGTAYALPTSAHLTDDSASSSSPGLLKTPTAQLAVNGGSQHPDKRREGGHGPTLADQIECELLPTPTATPYGNNQSPSPGAAVRPSLDTLAPTLLPTPVTTDAKAARNSTANRRDGHGAHVGDTLTDVLVPPLLPTPRAQVNRSSRRAMTGELPREFESWQEIPGWLGDHTAPPSNDGNESSDDQRPRPPSPAHEADSA